MNVLSICSASCAYYFIFFIQVLYRHGKQITGVEDLCEILISSEESCPSCLLLFFRVFLLSIGLMGLYELSLFTNFSFFFSFPFANLCFCTSLSFIFCANLCSVQSFLSLFQLLRYFLILTIHIGLCEFSLL